MSHFKKYFSANSVLARWKLQTVVKKEIKYDQDNLEPGDVVLATPVFGFIPYFYHYGVYVGDERIVHVQSKGVVECSLDEFIKNRTKAFIDKLHPLPHEIEHPSLFAQRREYIVSTAKTMVGEEWKFRAISENCESFSNWVTTGKMHSQQGTLIRNITCLYGVSMLGYFIGRRNIRFWRLTWWRKNIFN